MKKTILGSLAVMVVCAGVLVADDTVVVSTGTSGQAGQGDTITNIRNLAENIHSAKDAHEKARFREELSKQKPASNEEIEEMLNLGEDKDDEVKRGAMESLINVKDPSTAPIFRKRIKNGNVYTRAVAVKKAWEFKDKEAVPDLIGVAKGFKGRKNRTMEEGYEMFSQLDALQALGDIGDERAIPVLISKLGKDGDNVEIPRAAAKFGRKIFPQLLDMANYSTDKDQHLAVGNAIGMMTDKSIVPDLWKLVQEKGWFTSTLLDLADNTTTPTQDEVKQYLEINAVKQHLAYMGYLIEFAGKKKDVKYLLTIAQDKSKDDTYRGFAIKYLGDLHVQEAEPVLEDFFKNGDRNLSGSAATALEKITDRKCDRDTRTFIK